MLLRPSIRACTSVSRCLTYSATRFSSSQSEERLMPTQTDTLLDIGSRKIFNSDHDMLRTSARKFFNEEVKPFEMEWEEAGLVPRSVWTKAGSLGFLGISVPEELGGPGGTFLDSAIVLEEQAYANSAGPGFGAHSHIVVPYLCRYGNDEQRAKFIPPMLSGEKIGALAMTEPGCGSDLQSIKTYAKQDGDDWILNGSKIFITNGILSDVVIVVAGTNPTAKSPAHGISLFLVEEGMKGFMRGKNLKKLGMKAQDTAELFFEDVRLPASALLGGPNKGFYSLMENLPEERLVIAVASLANTEWMFEETRAYLKQRIAFGKPLIEKQALNHKLAEIKTSVCVARSFVDDCIQKFVDGNLDTYTASMAKYWATDVQNKVANDCLQLHGGWGFMHEMPICRAFATARVQPIYGGTNEIMKELIARQIKS